MGYTHYWSFKARPKGLAKQTEETYQLAVRQCQKLIRSYNKDLKAIDNKHPNRLSGFSAHTKRLEYNGLEVNGTQDLSHEKFYLREHYSQNESFNFCKTASKPYDIVVVACLVILKHYLSELIEVSSDGESKDWSSGLMLAKQYTKIKSLVVPFKKAG